MEGMFNLFVNLLAAHLVGDFIFQSDKTCLDKREKRGHSFHLYLHSLIIGLLTWCALGYVRLYWLALIVALVHLLIDWVKSHSKDRLNAFLYDQLAHLVILIAISWIGVKFCGWMQPQSYICFQDLQMWFIAFIICGKPANVLIKKVLEAYKISTKSKRTQLQFKAGGLIGTLERWLILVFICLDQYEAIGFLIAAKSIIRYRDTETDRTEYVLAGTLISVSISVACGVLVKLLN